MSTIRENRVLVSDNLSRQGIELLEKESGISVDVKTGLSEDELVRIINDYDALIVRSATKVTQRVIENASRLVVIGRAGIGLDNVNVEAASRLGIIVMNTPEGNVVTTAEHAMSLLLSMAREIPQAYASMQEKKWDRKSFMGVEVCNKTFGIVGLGRVGSIIARLAKAMLMRVIVYDPFISLQAAKKMEVEIVEFEDLLKNSDFISVHTPLTKSTRNILNKETFSKMKKGVHIVNCARGGIVNEKDLLWAIEEGIVGGAAFDVFEEEPPKPDNPLIQNPKVICTPHLGASTVEAQENVAIAVVEQVIDVLKTGTIRNAVNAPCVSKEILVQIEPYLSLAEKLGYILAQLTKGRLEKVEIQYSGDALQENFSFLTIAAIKGILEPILREQVNYVNAPIIARSRNIQINEVRDNSVSDYPNMITIILYTEGKDGGEFSISGTIFRKHQPRIVALNGFHIETAISRNMIILYNEDMPGVVGEIGTTLGKERINIGSMKLGRDTKKGLALSIINVDCPLEEDVISSLRKTTHVINVKMIKA